LSETTFKPTPKMASYLLAISVGDFAALRGRTNNNMLVRVWTWTGMQNNGELSLRVCCSSLCYRQRPKRDHISLGMGPLDPIISEKGRSLVSTMSLLEQNLRALGTMKSEFRGRSS
jgi:hypothetical protein